MEIAAMLFQGSVHGNPSTEVVGIKQRAKMIHYK
jgi:hypothetical protein